MSRFRESMDAYSEITAERKKTFMGTFFGKTSRPLLVAAEEVEPEEREPSSAVITDITDVVPEEVLEAIPDMVPTMVMSTEAREVPTEHREETVTPVVSTEDLVAAAIVEEAIAAEEAVVETPTDDFSSRLGASVEPPEAGLEADVTEEITPKPEPEVPTTDFSIGTDG